MSNGKTDKPRNCFSKEFKDNYDTIFRKPKPKYEKHKHLKKEFKNDK